MFRKLLCSYLLFISMISILPTVTKAADLNETYENELQELLFQQDQLSKQLKDEQSKQNALLNVKKEILLDAQKTRAELNEVQEKLTAQRKQVSIFNQKIKDYRKNNAYLLKGTKAQKAKYIKELGLLQNTYKQIQAKVTSLKNEVTQINQNYSDIKNKLNQNRIDITANLKAIRQSNMDTQALNYKVYTAKLNIAINNKNNNNIYTYNSNRNTNVKVDEQPTIEKETVSEPYLIDSETLTEAEKELARLINEYRESLGLKPFPISKSLTKVARTHVIDSNQYTPENGVDSRGEDCNLHSWSANGTWSAVCYTPDHEYAEKMWNKPSELTSYQGNGYEISVYSSYKMSPALALRLWKNSNGHNNVIIGDGYWSDLTVMGVGIHDGYAHVWFGKESDSAGYIK